MRNKCKKVVLAIMVFAIMFGVKANVANATEDSETYKVDIGKDGLTEIKPSLPTKNNDPEHRINEPLDNSVPTIHGYQVMGDGVITPGKEFTLKFNIYNPAVISNAGNVVITVNQKEGLIYPANGKTNSIYVGYINTLSYRECELNLVASKDIKTEGVPIEITLAYTDNYSTLNAQNLTAVLPVSKSGTLSINAVEIPSTMYVGSNNRLSITYSNDGLSTINDVTLHLSGASIETREISLGSIGSSTTVNSDVYLGIIEEGEQSVDMYFTYKDREGQTVETEKRTYSFDVSSFGAPVSNFDEEYLNRRYSINRILTICMLSFSAAFVAMYFKNSP